MMTEDQALQFKICIDALFAIAHGTPNAQSLRDNVHIGNEYQAEYIKIQAMAEKALKQIGLQDLVPSKPTRREVETFIKCFDDLASFEGTHRMIRSHGLYNDENAEKLRPINIKVRSWLTKEFDIKDGEPCLKTK